jgi:ankyrin repeat protein
MRRKFGALKRVFDKGTKLAEADMATIKEYQSQNLTDLMSDYENFENFYFPRFSSDDVNSQVVGGNMRLHYFSRGGFMREVENIIENPFSEILTQNDKGETPLSIAHPNVVEVLVKHIMVNNLDPVMVLQPDIHGNTLLHFAAIGGLENHVKELHQKGLSINAQNKKGKSPTHLACLHQQDQVLKYLVAQPEWEDLRDAEGNTSLDIKMNKKEVAEILVNVWMGKDEKVKDNNDNSLLHFAAAAGLRMIGSCHGQADHVKK